MQPELSLPLFDIGFFPLGAYLYHISTSLLSFYFGGGGRRFGGFSFLDELTSVAGIFSSGN
jgi:hypothetical protein